MDDSTITNQERAELADLAGFTGTGIAEGMSGAFGEVLDSLPIADTAKRAAALLAAAECADLAVKYRESD